jgi:hypothetical protein
MSEIGKDVVDVNPEDVTPLRYAGKDFDRLTMRLNVYQEHCCDTPHMITLGHSEELENMVAAYSRTVKVYETWKLIDLGWIEEEGGHVGYIVFEVKRKKHLQNVTQEEVQEDKNRCLLISLRGDGKVDLEIPTGHFNVIRVADPSKIMARCDCGAVEVATHIYTR